MKTAIVFDTETTGFPLFKERSDDPRQPHIVQLAAAMIDLDTRETVQSINLIVRPDDWGIPKESADVHGITYEMAMDTGIPEADAISAFYSLIENSDGSFRLRIAHNESFDARIIRIATKRFLTDEIADSFRLGKKYCTMRESTNIVCCPPTEKMIASGRNHYKNPNLSEAYRHFTGKDLEGAHDAMVDVNACIDVYFGIQDHEDVMAF